MKCHPSREPLAGAFPFSCHAQTLIFSDNFNIADTASLDGSNQIGRHEGVAATEVELRSGGVQHRISTNQLNILPGGSSFGRVRFQNAASLPSNVLFDFAGGASGAQILADGGFRFEFDWTPPNNTTDDWVSVNVGFNYLDTAVGVVHPSTDFGVFFRNNGGTQVFDNNVGGATGTFDITNLGPRHGTIDFTFGSFADGSTVTANIYVDSAATWTFPSVTLGAQQYRLVFASEKNRTTAATNLHTNFKLSSEGEYLALKNAAGTVIAEFGPSYPPQRPDISHGRRSNGDAAYFLSPSPGTTNGFSFLGFVGDTAFSVKRGFYTTPQTVAISTITPGATIRYTLDGSTPTETHGTAYSTPLTISGTTTLRARAFHTDYLATNTDTNTYVFPADVLQQSPATAQSYGSPLGPLNGQEFRHGLKPALTSQYTSQQMLAALQQIPTMSIVTDQPNLTNPSTGIYVNPGGDGLTWERPVSLELINPDGTPGFQENCGLCIRGGQSRTTSFPKHSFHVNFRSQYGAGKLDYRLFGNGGANEFDTFDLRCEHGYAYADPQGGTYGIEYTAMRDVFCREMSGASGYATTRSNYYHLYLNGQYWGLYQTQERPQDDYGETYFGGTKEEYDVIKATGLPQRTIENSSCNYDAWTQLWNGCRAVANNPTNGNYFALLGRNANGNVNPALPVLLDPRELAGYMLLHYYCGHSDEPL